MKIIPVLTEKSLGLAQEGKYTFWVSPNATKHQIKKEISEVFGVNVVNVWTQKRKGIEKVNLQRKKVKFTPKKKATVTLKDKQRIGLFETEKKK